MTIKGKLAAGFLAIALLAAVAGGFGISASRQIVMKFEGSEQHFRSIVWAATEMTSYAKRAEGHLLQYLLLGDRQDREKFFLRHSAMHSQLEILESRVRIEEARKILQEIATVEEDVLAYGVDLLSARDASIAAGRPFPLWEQDDLLQRFQAAVRVIEEAGLRLAHLETGFLNKQAGITAATELSSFIKRAESELLMYLILGRQADMEGYLESSYEVRAEIAHLNDRLETAQSRMILEEIGGAQEEFFRIAGELIRARDHAREKEEDFDFLRSAPLIRGLNSVAANVRERGVEIAKIETAVESRYKNEAIAGAEAIRRNIILAMAALVLASMGIGFFISRAILVPIRRLQDAVLQLGAGNLDVRIENSGTDEIGTLAECFNQMAGDLKSSVVSVNYVENILQSMMDAVVVLAADLHIERVNFAACALSGFSEQELVGRPSEFLLDGAGDLMQEVLAAGSERRPEVNLRTSDGRLMPVLFSGAIIRGSQGVLTGLVLALRDMSDLHRAEAEKRELQAQLQHSQKMETIGTLAGGIAHDFNNLLTPILGFSQICWDELPPGSSQAACLERVIAAAERARDLVRQIVTFSRQDDLQLRHVRVDPVVRDAVALLRAALPKSITLRSHIEEEVAAFANPTQIHQIVMNLGTNALQAMEDGGTLEIRLESVRDADAPKRKGDFLLLTVRDSGCGMDPGVMERIFEPFFTTKEVGRGTGLGLSVVHGIVQGHGGEIVVESQPGEGTVFRVYLPVAAGIGAEQPLGTAGEATTAGIRILLVDDEEGVVLLGREMLKRLGHQVTTANDPRLALEIFRKDPGRFDLLISDYSMPGVDGVALAQTFKAIRAELPVIIMTGFGAGLISSESLGPVVQACLAKPFLQDDLDRVVRQVLASSAVAESAPLLATAAGR